MTFFRQGSTRNLSEIKIVHLYRLGAVIWLLTIIALLFLPGDDLPDVQYLPHQDKLIHFVLFSVYSFLWLSGFYRVHNLGGRVSASIILGFGVFTAVLTEWIQQRVPGRQGDLIDMLLDLIGLAAGAIFYFLLEKRNHSAKN